MGKKSKSSAPPPVDVNATAAAQTAANKAAIEASAKVNAVDIEGPYGSTTYTRDANGVPIKQTTALSDSSKAIYDQQQVIGKQLADIGTSRLQGIDMSNYSTAGLPYDPRSVDVASMPTYRMKSAPRGDPAGAGSGPYSGPFGGGAEPPAPTGAFGAADLATTSAGQPSTTTPPAVTGGSAPFGVPAGAQSPQVPFAASVNAGAVPYDPNSYGNMATFNNNVGNAMWSQGMSRVMPQIENQNRQFDQMMADRGIPIGSDAYHRARTTMDRGQNDLITSLNNSATTGSLGATKDIVGLEQGLRSTAYGENVKNSELEQKDWLTQLQAGQGLRSTANAENLATRNQSLNEVAQILQGSPQIGTPNAPNMATYNQAAPDIVGLTNANQAQQMKAYEAQQAKQGSMMSGIMGIAKAALPIVAPGIGTAISAGLSAFGPPPANGGWNTSWAPA